MHAADEVLAEPLVAQHVGDVGVPARHEKAEQGMVHRVGLTQAPIVGIGIVTSGDRIEQRLRGEPAACRSRRTSHVSVRIRRA